MSTIPNNPAEASETVVSGFQITINGTADSWEDEDRCGHTWHEVEYEGQVYQNLTCGGCPVRCLVQEAPPCGPPDDPHTSSSRTFWVYFVLRMIATFFLASLFTMMVGYNKSMYVY